MRYTVEILNPADILVSSYQAATLPPFNAGDAVVIGEKGEAATVVRVEHQLDEHGHHMRIHTVGLRDSELSRPTAVSDFLRYHVLIRVFGGDAAGWLKVLTEQKRDRSEEAIFVRWLRNRLEADHDLLTQIRQLVDQSGLWP